MYLNDDSVSIMAVSLIVLIMSWIIKSGVSTRNVIMFALAVGVAVISKKSAWIFMPIAILFYLIYILRLNKDFLRHHFLMLLAFIVAGGWWLGFNMFHYGLSDPFLSGIGAEITERYVRVDLSRHGFQAQGISISNLLLDNHKGFIFESYYAFVGYLGWLEIRLGVVQYGFYFILVFGLIANIAFLISETILTKLKDRQVQLEWLLYLAIGLQILAYTWLNVYRDIQIQGKYLLPVVLPILILGLSFYVKMFGSSSRRRFSVSRSILLLLLLLAPVFVHLHAIAEFVVPFYWPELELDVLIQQML